jgi:hypothetical protein
MKREYPSIPAEAFQQSIEGAYYAKQFIKLYAAQRIGKLPDNSHLPVTPSGTSASATPRPSGSSGSSARNTTSSTSTRTAAKA